MSNGADDIRRRLDRIERAIEGLTLHGKAQVALYEQEMQQLQYLENLTQICIDQGKGFSASISRIERKLDELGL